MTSEGTEKSKNEKNIITKEQLKSECKSEHYCRCFYCERLAVDCFPCNDCDSESTIYECKQDERKLKLNDT